MKTYKLQRKSNVPKGTLAYFDFENLKVYDAETKDHIADLIPQPIDMKIMKDDGANNPSQIEIEPIHVTLCADDPDEITINYNHAVAVGDGDYRLFP